MIILCFITGLATVGFGLVLPAFLFYAQNLGSTPAVATVIIATYSMGQFIGTPIWGRLSDRIGRKPVLLISIFGQSICFVWLAMSSNLWMLAIARLFGGMISGNISTAMLRSWENRPDTYVCDEPLYAYYLNQTGKEPPGKKEIIDK